MNFEDQIQGLDDFTGFGGGAAGSYSSPVLTNFDVTASASSSTSNIHTVSPQDLLLHDGFMSAPNSNALTTLTSPSIYNGSPDFSDVSPAFSNVDFDTGDAQPWFPLFPQDNVKQQQHLVKPLSTVVAEQSPASKSDDLEVVERAPAVRRKSAGKSGNSPPTRTHASVSGVGSRRRDKPLPPIVVEDPHDGVAMKRARNTLAARKSRERKAVKLEELEEEIAQLKEDKTQLTEDRDRWKALAESRI
jgi:hypothetical protein